jgi:methylenetetrahydrofolate dehydrogenase (NADP+) / methenyltetrahydrofolate cyclohydrolase
MTASIIDGRVLAQKVRTECKARADVLGTKGITPGLAVVMVGDNPASSAYISNKVRACAEVGLHSEVHRIAADVPEDAVLATVGELNRNPRIHGIIVQLPLPAGLSATRILQSVAMEKDVDGFNWCNLGALADGHPRLVPCTPLGVVTLLERSGIGIAGANAVVVGRSSIVGRPLALLLLAASATVTVCHSRTRDLGEETARADLLFAATGRPGLITGEMVKPGAVVVDIGINRLGDGRLVGDVDFASVRRKASHITPVPGGVGPMTVAMLIANTVTAAEHRAAQQQL